MAEEKPAANRRPRGKWKDGLQKRGDAWYCRYVDASGKQKVKATGQPTLELARKYLAEARARVARGLAGVPEVTRKEREQRAITVLALCEDFSKKYTRPKLRDIERYRMNARSTVARRIRPYPIAHLPVAKLTAADVVELRDAIQRDEYSSSGVNDAIRLISTAITWAMDTGILPPIANPCSRVERMPTVASEEHYPLDDVHKLLRVQDLPAMVWTALYSGMRKGELFGLTWPCVRLTGELPRIEVRRSYRGPTKSGRPRVVPIHPELLPVLSAWEKVCPETAEELVFPVALLTTHKRPTGRYRMGRESDMEGLPDLLRRLNCHVPKERTARPGRSPRERAWHAMRHTFATLFLEASGNGDALSKILGHAQGGGAAAVTQGYTHTGLAYLARELEKMSLTPPPLAGVTPIQKGRRGQRVGPRKDPGLERVS